MATSRAGRPLAAGVKRKKCSISFLPDYAAEYQRLAEDLGLDFTDVIAYLAAKGAGQQIPEYIEKKMRVARNTGLAEPLIA